MQDTENAGDVPLTDESKRMERSAEEKSISFSWGILMVRTKRLLGILDNLARFSIFSGIGWIFLAITIVAAGVMIYLMVDQDYLVLTGSLAFRCVIGAATPGQCAAIHVAPTPQPSLRTYLLLPGLNPVIPLLYGIIGIVVAVVIHEGMHGVIARRLKLPVKSTGLIFLLIIPIGAFVEIDEKEIQNTRFRDSGRIMAGGPGSNIIVALMALAILLVIVGGLVPAQFNGVYVQQIVADSPANTLHLQGHLVSGDVITAVNGTNISSVDQLSGYLNNTRPNETLILSIEHKGQTNNYNLTLGVYPAPNVSKGFIGISQSFSQSDLVNIQHTYSSSFFKDPILYLLVPGILAQANSLVPFSNQLAPLYNSPVLGQAWYPIALTAFWIWFINVNLAFFNAIPLYPLDGGQALLNFFSHFGRKWVDSRAKTLTTIVSLLMFALILSFIFLPRLLGVVAI